MPAVAATQENGEFRFHIAIDEVFEKADDGDEKRMRIAGVISTDARDKQGERILQDGLDFDDFLRDGWFNDNHAKDTTGIVGYPTQSTSLRRGTRSRMERLLAVPGGG